MPSSALSSDGVKQTASSPPVAFTQPEPRQDHSNSTQTWIHIPKIPRATEACPHPLTLDQLIDWKVQLQTRLLTISRRATKSERDDESECDRQFHELDDEKDFEVYYSKEERNERRRTKHQRPLSPPRTPPHLKGPKLYKNQVPSLVPLSGDLRVKKTKSIRRVAPRRPRIRFQGTSPLSIHDRKGQSGTLGINT